VILRFLDYRFADSVLNHPSFRAAKDDVLRILKEAPTPLLNPDELDPRQGGVKRRRRKALRGASGDRVFLLPVDQVALNVHLDKAFQEAGWAMQPPIVSPGKTGGPTTGLKGDFKKGRLQVEVQFGNMARWYTDVFKFQLSYSLDEIDVAILVVPTQRFANLIDENVAYFERVVRELPWAKMSLTLPIWVIAVEPDDYSAVRACYERAMNLFVAAEAAAGRTVVPIPYDVRITEVPQDEDEG
jgi:restriction endonuclease BglII